MTNWLEVSLTVDGELAEAAADVLRRFAPDGVAAEQAVEFVDDEDEGAPVGPITVRAYLPVDEHLEETRRKLEEALYYLGTIQPLPEPVYRPVADQNWMEAWKVHYRPIPVGKKLIIVPAWLDSPDVQRIAIKIEPGMAFGTGTHPSTQLCLELLEAFFDQQTPIVNPLRFGPGTLRSRQSSIPFALLRGRSAVVNRQSSVIDVGCGSGILSIAALKLGAGHALGVDIDEASIRASGENAEANGVAESLTLGVGSVAEVLAGRFGVRQAPLVLANILAPVILRLFGAGLADLVAPGGALILAGILTEQAEAVLSAARSHGLKLVKRRQMVDWVALVCQR